LQMLLKLELFKAAEDSKKVDFKSFGDFASQTNRFQKDFTQ
jgi:hypothetical protein